MVIVNQKTNKTIQILEICCIMFVWQPSNAIAQHSYWALLCHGRKTNVKLRQSSVDFIKPNKTNSGDSPRLKKSKLCTLKCWMQHFFRNFCTEDSQLLSLVKWGWNFLFIWKQEMGRNSYSLSLCSSACPGRGEQW